VKKKTKISIEDTPGRSGKSLKVLGLTLLAAAAAGAALVLIVKDQMSRHRRNLFSPNVLQRLAALAYVAKRPASVDAITLLRDFIHWEPRPLLRGRARAILARMEKEARELEARAAAEKVG
jgi:hypothetical protein